MPKARIIAAWKEAGPELTGGLGPAAADGADDAFPDAQEFLQAFLPKLQQLGSLNQHPVLTHRRAMMAAALTILPNAVGAHRTSASCNPVALRMQELETLERVAERIDKFSVFGGLDQVLNRLVKLR